MATNPGITGEELKARYAQQARAGLPFNPVDGLEIAGANIERLKKGMETFGWSDLRFVTKDQAVANGWTIRPKAESVEIRLRNDANGTFDTQVLFNAANVRGMPSLPGMLAMSDTEFSRMRGLFSPEAEREDELAIGPARGLVRDAVQSAREMLQERWDRNERVSNTPAYRAIEGNYHGLMVVPRNELSADIARDIVSEDIKALRNISDMDVRHFAALMIVSNMEEQESYRAELARQAPEIAAELPSAMSVGTEELSAQDAIADRPQFALQPGYRQLLAHGAAPYQKDPKNKLSYYVELQDENGVVETVWGLDLERSLTEAKAQIGDAIAIEENGFQSVTIDERQKDGTYQRKPAQRINWITTLQPLQRRIAEYEQPQNAYQAELARLLALSTLTPGSYTPGDHVKTANHMAVFVDEKPVILCGPSDDPASVSQAEALAASPQVQAAFRAAGRSGAIHSGVIAGSHVQWQGAEAAVVSKSSGQVEPGGDDGPLVAIVLNDPTQALTTSLCVNTAIARILDANAPELDDGRKLPALARGLGQAQTGKAFNPGRPNASEPADGRFAVMASYWQDGLHNFEGIELAKEINKMIQAEKLAGDKQAIVRLMSVYPKARSFGVEIVAESKYLNDPHLKVNVSEPRSLLKGDLVRDKEGAYRPKAGGLPVLRDMGDSVVLKNKSAQAYRGAMELALAKGWKAIELKGKPAMLAEAWIEAKLMGLDVVNYAPSDKDRVKYAQRLAEESRRRETGKNSTAEQSPEMVEIRPFTDSSGQERLATVTYTVSHQGGKDQQFSAPKDAANAFAVLPTSQMPVVIRTVTRADGVVRNDVVAGSALKHDKAGLSSSLESQVDQEFEAAMAEVIDAGKATVSQRQQAAVATKGLHVGPITAIEGGRIAQKVGRDPDKVVWHSLANLSGVTPQLGEIAEIGYSKGVGKVKEKVRAKAQDGVER